MTTTYRTAIALIAAAIVFAVIAVIGRGAPGNTDPEGCNDIAAYRDALVVTQPEPAPADEPVVEAFLSEDLDFDTMRPSQARMLSDHFDRWASNIEAMDPDAIPPVAEQHHTVTVEAMGLMSSALNSYATGGLLALMPYTEPMAELEVEMAEVTSHGVRSCGDAWTDVFGDGNNLVGEGGA